MPRKRTGYDAACYYDGKLLGRCTKADSDAYTLLMNAFLLSPYGLQAAAGSLLWALDGGKSALYRFLAS